MLKAPTLQFNLNPRWLVLTATLVSAGPTLAGAISGTLTKPGNRPIGVVEVKLVCGGTESVGKSDAQGNYSLAIAASGLCTLVVGGGKSSSVLLGKNPARYNFEVPDAGAALVQR
jgi:hypothetical protein